jgi:4-aminobutyrate aminotransferase-like enzyme
MTRQAATLNVHTRYLHETILDYGERLTATFDSSLDSILFACTGSEANDQALRLARALSGRQGVICTNLTYHGNTTAVDAVSPLFYGRVVEHPDVRTIPFPDTYRAPQDLRGAALTAHYLTALERAIASLQASGVGLAALIVCPIFANEGLPDVPPGFLAGAVARVRAAGGLVIADEVQAGFGRTGRMWGHQIAGIVPDLVTLGKPMGNGYPIAAVVTRADLVREFRERVMYFNTFGGNPVACAVAAEVLTLIERERLVDNAQAIGTYLRTGLADLATRHAVLGEVRGHGLWVGIELVLDRESRTPATALAERIVNAMKDAGVLLGRIGAYDNVLKIRPPLVIERAHADLLLARLDDTLSRHAA